jgi:integrase
MAKTKRRGHGEGSIYQRSDGRWVGEITLENGKRKPFYGKTRKEAADKLQQALYEQKQGMLATGPQQKLGPYLNQWLEEVHKSTLRIGTYKRYRIILDKHLIPYLGHLPLQKVTSQQVQAAYAKILKSGYKPKTIKTINAVLHKALDQAIRWRLLARNVCNEVSLPRTAKFDIHPLTREQVQKLLDTARGYRFETMLTLALMTGMRRGELLGLRWSDIDFETGNLHISRSVGYVTGCGFVEAEPKTAASNRTIPLPQFVIDLLRQHRLDQAEARSEAGERWQEHDLVFCNRTGGFFSISQLYKQFRILLYEAGLPDMRFHDLRHSAATVLLTMGVHPKVVQERLGHSQISMTLDTYSHVLPSMQQEATDKLNDLFGKQK